MRSSLTRAAALLAAAAAFPLLMAGPAAAEEQSQYCFFVPSLYVGLGPRPMTTYSEVCVPWP